MPDKNKVVEVDANTSNGETKTESKSINLLSMAKSGIKTVVKADRMAIVALILANLLPIIFAIVFQWKVFDVVLFYWLENVVIGIFALLRIAMASGGGRQMAMARVVCVPFFTFHFFFFCFGHLVVMNALLTGHMSQLQPTPSSVFSILADKLPAATIFGVIVLIGSHGLSFVRNYIKKGEYKTAIPMIEMFRPYGRIVVMHVGILIGAFAIIALDAPLVLLIVLMLCKTVFDLITHCVFHQIQQSGFSLSTMLKNAAIESSH